jgi:hypothetical protein
VEREKLGQEPAGCAPGADPIGIAIAFGAAALSDRQLDLVKLRAEELRRDIHFHRWSVRVHHISDVLKLAFEIAVGSGYNIPSPPTLGKREDSSDE